jgi:histidinol-phosphatase (PHP family)
MIDLHVHTGYCPHATGSVSEYVEAAKSRGIGIIGFSDHHPLPEGFNDPVGGCALDEARLGGYLRELRSLGDEMVLTGVEADHIRGFENWTGSRLSGLEVDYVIGSVHLLDGWCFDYSVEMFEEGVMERYNGDYESFVGDYFRAQREMISLGWANIIGHMDLCKIFNPREELFGLDCDAFREGAKRNLHLMRDNDMVLEVNTSGLHKPVGEFYPTRHVLELAFELGVKVTLGSDAHRPGQVGRDFRNAMGILRSVGYERLHYFRGKKQYWIPLDN